MSDSPTYLLTGATGLLGRFILARLLRNGHQVVVLARSTAVATAQQRIEQALQPFEERVRLPRPRILEGELNLPSLGLNHDAITSIATAPLRVIHSAASIRFVAQSKSDEPYATNVNGTRHLLELVREFPLLDFHHVSTAYVGVRQGLTIVPETWISSPDVAGNDYERSKILAEGLVRDCPWLPARVIHRPSIIIGDSRSGFTSTYHGFYAPLQIGAQYAQRFGLDSRAADLFRSRLGMRQDDRKNLVPVDWVADAIATVATSPPVSQDRILHWTNPAPVACSEMQAAIIDSLRLHYGSQPIASESDKPRHDDPMGEMLTRSEDFRQQMQVYESYFGADPVFSTEKAEHALAVSGGSPATCPSVDGSLMQRMARYALEKNFGWPRPSLATPPSRETSQLLKLLDAMPSGSIHSPNDRLLTIEVDLLGPWAPGRITMGRSQDGWGKLSSGSPADNRWIVPLDQLVDCIIGKVGAIELIEQGYWVIRGTRRNDWLEIINDWVKDVSSRFPSGSL